MGPSLSSNAALLPRLNKLNATTEKKKITSFAGNFKKSTDGFVEFGFASKTHKKKKTEQTMQQITQSVPGNKKKMSSKQEICTNSRMKKSKGKKTSFSRERDINGHGYQLKVKYTPAHITLKKAIFTWISLVEIGLIVTAAAVLIIEIAVLPG